VCLKILSPLQVKNKPHDADLEHALIIFSLDCTVANNLEVIYIHWQSDIVILSFYIATQVRVNIDFQEDLDNCFIMSKSIQRYPNLISQIINSYFWPV
jgi:hypothetical protein